MESSRLVQSIEASALGIESYPRRRHRRRPRCRPGKLFPPPNDQLFQGRVGLPLLARNGAAGHVVGDSPPTPSASVVVDDSVVDEISADEYLRRVTHFRRETAVGTTFSRVRITPSAERKLPPPRLHVEEDYAARDEDKRWPEHAMHDVILRVAFVDDDVLEVGGVVEAPEVVALRRMLPLQSERLHQLPVLFRIFVALRVIGTLQSLEKKHPAVSSGIDAVSLFR